MLAAYEKPQAVISEEPESGDSEGAVQLSNRGISHQTNTGKRTQIMKCSSHFPAY
jgi:hypothetical protein